MLFSQLAISTYPWRESVLDSALDAIRPLGVPGVEIHGRLPHMDADPRRARVEVLRAAAASRGLRWVALATAGGAAFMGEDEAAAEDELARVVAALDLARDLDATVIRVFRVGRDVDRADWVDRLVPWYRRAAVHAEAVGVRMGLESHSGGISGDPEVCGRLFEAVGSSHFGLIYDPCSYLTRGGDYAKALARLARHVVHVHIKDATREPGSEQRTMLGEGELDLPWIVARLRDLGYGGWLTLEYEARNVPPALGLPHWVARMQNLLG